MTNKKETIEESLFQTFDLAVKLTCLDQMLNLISSSVGYIQSLVLEILCK